MAVTEAARLVELAAYRVMDTAPERAFDDIVQAAAEAAGCPTALVSLLDQDRQWFKARHGTQATETPRHLALCEHTLQADAPLVVADATLDPRFVDHPLVTGPPGVRFYAGFPLRTPTGAVLGTLCVVDYVPHSQGLSDPQRRLLGVLAAQVMTQLELRRALAEQEGVVRELKLAVDSYQALADHATDVVSRHLLDGTTEYVSPSIATVLGYDADAEVGHAAPDRLHPQDAARMAAAIGEVLAGRPARATVRTRHADGSWRHLEVLLSPVRDASGAVARIHSVARDVSERMTATELLAVSEERFRVLFDANPVGQVELSPAGVVQRVNRAFANLLGVQPGDVLGRTSSWATADQDQPDQEQAVLSAAATPGQVLHSQQTLQREDGTCIEVVGTVVGVAGEDGRTAVLIGSVLDVTQRNEDQRRLTELAAQLQSAHDAALQDRALMETVLQTVDVGLVACDAQGRLTLFNSTARDFHGLPADAGLDPVRWTDAYALLAQDGCTPLELEQGPLVRALTEGKVEDAVIVIAPRDQAPRTVRCDGRQMRDPDGRLLGAVVAMSDITTARHTARSLADQAEYTRVLLETAHTAIWSCDRAGRPTYANPIARAILGWPDLETLRHLRDTGQSGQPAGSVEMLHPDGQPLGARERPLARALAGEETSDLEVLLTAPGRTRRSLLLHASPLRDSDGQVTGALLTGHDVTALRASEARFRAAFHNGPTPLARLDGEGRVLEVNPALRRLTSRRDRALVGSPLREHVLVEDQRRLRRVLTGPGTGAEPVEIRLLRADGAPVWCELATTVSADEDGRVSVLAQFLDVDARKAQEAVLEQAAQRDPLTGLPNRSRLLTSIQALTGAADPGLTAGLLFVDLDGFKTINDEHGHDAGDAVLVSVAERLRATIRPDDEVLRLGGDEFVVLCAVSTTQPDDVLQSLARRLEAAVAVPIEFRGRRVSVGCSIGAGRSRPGQSAEELVDAADRDMYRSKRAKRAAVP